MKSYKNYAWLYISLTVVAITGYLIWVSLEGKNGIIAAKNNSSRTNDTAKKQILSVQEESAAKIPMKKQLSPKGLVAQQRYHEAKARSDSAAVKLGSLYTPEYCAKAADAKMKLRVKHYQNLFDSWNLDAKAKSEVIRVLREREMRMVKNAGDYLRGSHSLNDLREKNSSDKAEDWVSKELLSLHLDESQVTELLKLVRMLDKEEAALAADVLPIDSHDRE